MRSSSLRFVSGVFQKIADDAIVAAGGELQHDGGLDGYCSAVFVQKDEVAAEKLVADAEHVHRVITADDGVTRGIGGVCGVLCDFIRSLSGQRGEFAGDEIEARHIGGQVCRVDGVLVVGGQRAAQVVDDGKPQPFEGQKIDRSR